MAGMHLLAMDLTCVRRGFFTQRMVLKAFRRSFAGQHEAAVQSTLPQRFVVRNAAAQTESNARRSVSHFALLSQFASRSVPVRCSATTQRRSAFFRWRPKKVPGIIDHAMRSGGQNAKKLPKFSPRHRWMLRHLRRKVRAYPLLLLANGALLQEVHRPVQSTQGGRPRMAPLVASSLDCLANMKRHGDASD